MDKMLKIDRTDRKVLFELDKNARQPYRELAKKVGASEDMVRYRVKRLVDNDVIQVFNTVLQSAKLGFAYHKLWLKLHNVNERRVGRIINYLVYHSSVVWVSRMYGAFDIGVTVKVHRIHELGMLMEDLLAQFSANINNRVFAVNLIGEYLTRDYFVRDCRRKPKVSSYSVYLDPVKLTDTEEQILHELAKNARTSATEIAEVCSVSTDTVLSKIRRLEKEGVISRYNLVLNHEALGRLFYKVMINANHISPERQQEFLDHCRRKANIAFMVNTLGQWDYEFDVEVATVAEHRELMMDLTKNFSDVIRDYQSVSISKIHKYNLFPQ